MHSPDIYNITAVTTHEAFVKSDRIQLRNLITASAARITSLRSSNRIRSL